MILCNNCKHQNVDGSVFCSECGSQLSGKDALTTQHIETTELHGASKDKVGAQRGDDDRFQSFDVSDAWGSLHLLDTGHVIPLQKKEFTLGRVSEGQPIMPDIDLSAYQAYAAGVSRLHAVIKRAPHHMVFMDLGSANGSFINGRKLPPNEEQQLSHGDIVALGKMKIQVLLKSPS